MNEDLEKYAAVWPDAQKWAGRIAREAVEWDDDDDNYSLNQTVATSIIAAALVAERKRCAEVAHGVAKSHDIPFGSQPAYEAAYEIALAIESGQ